MTAIGSQTGLESGNDASVRSTDAVPAYLRLAAVAAIRATMTAAGLAARLLRDGDVLPIAERTDDGRHHISHDVRFLEGLARLPERSSRQGSNVLSGGPMSPAGSPRLPHGGSSAAVAFHRYYAMLQASPTFHLLASSRMTLQVNGHTQALHMTKERG